MGVEFFHLLDEDGDALEVESVATLDEDATMFTVTSGGTALQVYVTREEVKRLRKSLKAWLRGEYDA